MESSGGRKSEQEKQRRKIIYNNMAIHYVQYCVHDARTLQQCLLETLAEYAISESSCVYCTGTTGTALAL